MGRSPYPARRIPVDRTPSLPGAPRGPRTSPVAATRDADDSRRSGVNAGDGTMWGRSVAPVTGRQSRKSPGWRSNVAGGEYIVAPGV